MLIVFENTIHIFGLPGLCIHLCALFRLLAHAKTESLKTKEAAEQRRLKKKGWFSFGWLVATLFSYPFPCNNLHCICFFFPVYLLLFVFNHMY